MRCPLSHAQAAVRPSSSGEDVGMVSEALTERLSAFHPRKLDPFGEGQVAGHQVVAALVTVRHQVERVPGLGPWALGGLWPRVARPTGRDFW